MDLMDLLVELHLGGERQGPGSDAATRRALDLAGLGERSDLRIADLGCGTGASTLVLASDLDAHITAVDFLQPFLDRLVARAAAAGVSERITPLCASIDALPFEPGSLDVVWSEGAIYNLGFAAGVAAWRPLLAPGGVLAVSDLTWLTASRPAELQAHWDAEYPDVDLASARFAILEAHGLSPIGYFPLPPSCWLDAYYRPIQARLPGFLQAHGDLPLARELADAERAEIDLYERHQEYVSYGFYVARAVDVAPLARDRSGLPHDGARAPRPSLGSSREHRQRQGHGGSDLLGVLARGALDEGEGHLLGQVAGTDVDRGRVGPLAVVSS